MSATYKVGDYVVNASGSVGIIETVTCFGYEGTWYNGGRFSSHMRCDHSIARRYAELDDIMKHLPDDMKGMAILEYGKRLQAEEDAKAKPKYSVGDFVLSKYENPFAVGVIIEVTPTHYIGEWYRDEELHLEMDCRHDVIQRRATIDEWTRHVPMSAIVMKSTRKKLERTQAEEEMAMTTIEEVAKVTVTAEEKEALDIYSRYHKGKTVGQLADNFFTQKDKWSDVYVPLREMGIEKFIDAMTKGYEVEEPKIDVGDRVVYIGDGEGFKGVATVMFSGDFSSRVMVDEDTRHNAFTKNLRLATEEELVWHELGREVGEFRVGDRYRQEDGYYQVVYSVGSAELAKERYEEGKVRGFFPADTFVDFTKGGNA